MRSLGIVIVLLILAVGLVYYNCTQNRHNEANIEQDQSVNSMVSGAIHQPHGVNEHANTYDASQDCLYRAYLAAAIFGVLGALAGIYILHRQTVATEIAAKAAKTSADCLKAIQRPWLLVKNVDVTTEELAGGIKAIAIKWDIKNYGKVPGLVTEIGTHIDVVPASHQFTQPTFEKPYAIIFDEPVVPPRGKSFPMISAMKRGWGISEQENVTNGSLIFWISGRILYTSPWKDKYETWFSLKIDDIKTGKNSPVGPKELNKVK